MTDKQTILDLIERLPKKDYDFLIEAYRGEQRQRFVDNRRPNMARASSLCQQGLLIGAGTNQFGIILVPTKEAAAALRARLEDKG